MGSTRYLKAKEKYNCVCGASVQKKGKPKHEKSKLNKTQIKTYSLPET